MLLFSDKVFFCLILDDKRGSCFFIGGMYEIGRGVVVIYVICNFCFNWFGELFFVLSVIN